MGYEIIELLMNKDYDTLCSKFNLYNFQSKMLCFIYNTTNSLNARSSIVSSIERGDYTTESKLKDMFKSFIDKAIRYSKDNGFKILVEKCKLNEIDAASFINNYLRENKNIDDMLSAELDVSNNNIRMNEMIDSIMPAFLESEKEKSL